MAKPIAQILSNETENSKGFIVLNSTIDWKRYNANRILLFNPDTGEHYGKSIGHVDNIRLEGGNWIGELVFGTSALAQEARKNYEEGNLNGVSIFGKARIVERNGKRYTTYFEVWEISLVNIPSNPDAVAIRDKKVGLSAVEFYTTHGEEIVTGLSAEETEIINQFEQNMEEEKKEKNLVSLDAVGDFLAKIGLAPKRRKERIADDLDRDADQDDRDAGQDERDAREDEKMADKDREEAREERASALSAEAPTVETVVEKEVPTGLSVGEGAKVLPINQPISKSNKTMIEPFFKYVENPANAGKIARVVALSASNGSKDGLTEVSLSAAADAETLDSIQELAASMQADPRFMTTVQNMTFQVNGGRKVSATETIEGLASGQKSGQFVQNADLAKVIWLSLFVRQLFPSNTWADRVRRLSVADREGIIWVESAVNPDIYFGDRAPVEAPNYLYDDLPRGLERKVFSMQPIVWQSANSDILAYNDVATGTSEAMRKMTTAIHNYWLQVIAEAVPAANQIMMSGTTFDSAGRFPINPAAAGNLKGMTVNDLLSAQGRFIARNLTVNRRSLTAVLAEPYFTSLQQTDEIKSILTQQLSNARPDGFTYSGFDVMARSIIAAYNTATNTVVDAETYFDKPVDFATGAIDDSHVKPVLAGTVYDIGLGFIPEEVVVAIGNTNIHMVSDPNNYGWKMSMDVSTGAGTLRSGAIGIVLYRPTTA